MLATGILLLILGISLGFLINAKQLAIIAVFTAVAVGVWGAVTSHDLVGTSLLLALAVASLQLGYLVPLFVKAALRKRHSDKRAPFAKRKDL
jgi:hypothetical protein